MEYLINEEIYNIYINKYGDNVDRWNAGGNLKSIIVDYYAKNKIKKSQLNKTVNLVSFSFGYGGKILTVQKFNNYSHENILNLNKFSPRIDPLVYSMLLFNNTNKEADTRCKELLARFRWDPIQVIGSERLISILDLDEDIETLILNTSLIQSISEYTLLYIVNQIKDYKNRRREVKTLLKRDIAPYISRDTDLFSDEEVLKIQVEYLEDDLFKKIPNNSLNNICRLACNVKDNNELIERVFEICIEGGLNNNRLTEFLVTFKDVLDLSKIDSALFIKNYGIEMAERIGITDIVLPHAIKCLTNRIYYSDGSSNGLVMPTVFTAIDLLDEKTYKIMVKEVASIINLYKLKAGGTCLNFTKEISLVREDSTLFEDVAMEIINNIENLPLPKIQTRVKYIMDNVNSHRETLDTVLYNTLMKNLTGKPKISKFVMMAKI